MIGFSNHQFVRVKSLKYSIAFELQCDTREENVTIAAQMFYIRIGSFV